MDIMNYDDTIWISKGTSRLEGSMKRVRKEYLDKLKLYLLITSSSNLRIK